MKRLIFPAALVLASLVIAAVFTTITAVTLSSYKKDSKNSIMMDNPAKSSLQKSLQTSVKY